VARRIARSLLGPRRQLIRTFCKLQDGLEVCYWKVDFLTRRINENTMYTRAYHRDKLNRLELVAPLGTEEILRQRNTANFETLNARWILHSAASECHARHNARQLHANAGVPPALLEFGHFSVKYQHTARDFWRSSP
jgi:hypothetical protein